MLSLDEAVAKAARELDVVMEQITDKTAVDMIAAGEPEEIIAAFLELQWHQYTTWRPEALSAIGEQLRDF
jgi:hypothetical protein